jgi:protein TonB
LNRAQIIGIFVSLALHSGALMLGSSFFVQQAQFSVQASGGTTQVNLVATQPEEQPPSTEEIQKPVETPLASPKADDVIKTDKTKQKNVPTAKKQPTKPVPTTASGTPGAATSAPSSAKPDYLRNAPPVYPPFAKASHQQGVVSLLVSVSDKGAALSVSVAHTSGFKLLDDAALNAVRSWKFKPAMLGGIPVKSSVSVPVRFKLQ